MTILNSTLSRRAVLAGGAAVAAIGVTGKTAFAALHGDSSTKTMFADNRHACAKRHVEMAEGLRMDLIKARVRDRKDEETAALRGTQCPHCNTHIATSLDYMAVAV